MVSVLVAIRDFLIAMALAWVGITLEHSADHRAPREPAARSAPTACTDGAACNVQRPQFDALADCKD